MAGAGQNIGIGIGDIDKFVSFDITFNASGGTLGEDGPDSVTMKIPYGHRIPYTADDFTWETTDEKKGFNELAWQGGLLPFRQSQFFDGNQWVDFNYLSFIQGTGGEPDRTGWWYSDKYDPDSVYLDLNAPVTADATYYLHYIDISVDEVIWDHISYEFVSTENEFLVVGYKDTAPGSWNAVIKSTIDDFEVTEIMEASFMDCSQMISIDIPDTISSIAAQSFFNCANLSGNLIIPDSVTYIGGEAFRYCYGINGTLTLGKQVKTIEYNAFGGHGGQENRGLNFTGPLNIPASVESIGDAAFAFSSSFSSINFGENGSSAIKSIRSWAFVGCSGFSNALIIPAGVEYLGIGAFSDCSGLTGLQLLSGNLSHHLDDSSFVENSVADSAFANCTGLRGEIAIAEGIKIIRPRAFTNCSYITILTLPSSLEEIWDYAFENAARLAGSGANSIVLPSGLKIIGNYAFSSCGFTGALRIPDSVYQIGEYAFFESKGFNAGLTLSTHPDLTKLSRSIFEGCSSFTGNLIIPSNIKIIDFDAFSKCTGFNGTLTLSNNLTNINDRAFASEPATAETNWEILYPLNFVGSLTIPNSVRIIGSAVFMGCAKIDKLYLGSSLVDIGSWAFDGCKNIDNNLITPASLRTIAEGAFNHVEKVASVTLNSGLNYIGGYAFQACVSLTTVVIPADLPPEAYNENGQYAGLGNAIFDWCGALRSVTLPSRYTNGAVLAEKLGNAYSNAGLQIYYH